MGGDPLQLTIDGWTLEVLINDLGIEVRMHTDNLARSTHFMRLDRQQGYALQDYLNHNLPGVR